VAKSNYHENVADSIAAICLDPSIKEVLALPNYSAMLDLRKTLKGRGIL